jgi:hypothetical protein
VVVDEAFTLRVPGNLDPARAVRIEIQAETDRDHVGAEAVGRYGNNVQVFVLRVRDHAGAVLHSATFPNQAAAQAERAAIAAALDSNRQQLLF